ncbi:RagB/SusD family nutrient uptake outer membrane protein [Chitinophaga arvensicola]|uniref:SusD family protein n=1 Tax=Chitinophaga arvensicola TaxID=29529 RepID=A0A1I0S4T6_9BACT|nr:RagB/SusD family nutrient uptake outer membrane protein [Chitinophaga arvensicola]SEW49816.1 SusD family protein [Chitinophaga arvensicola]
MIKVAKNIIILLSLSVAGFVQSGCKKEFLEVTPKGVLIAQKTGDYDMMLNAASLHQFSLFSPAVMGDEVAGSGSFNVVGFGAASMADQEAFKWSDDIYLPNVTESEITMFVKQVYIYNKIIAEVMKASDGTDAQKNALRAEALMGRAWVHFLLVNLYGKPYNAATAATDLASPLFMTADVTQTTFTRATVKQLYDQIVADLNEAIPLLPETITNRARGAKPTAQALLGKVYVFMQQWDTALPLLQAFTTSLSRSTIKVGLYDYHKEFAANGTFLPIDPMNGPNRLYADMDNEVAYMRSAARLYGAGLDGVVMSSQTAALFTTDDERLKFFSTQTWLTGASYPSNMRRAWGQSYANMGVTVTDIYLLIAECKARLGQLPAAAEDLKNFRLTRVASSDAPVPTAIAGDKVALVKFILEERIREFALTGNRWLDMRRISVEPSYAGTVGNTHKVYDDFGKVTGTYTMKPERLTLRFAIYVMDANPTMSNNP